MSVILEEARRYREAQRQYADLKMAASYFRDETGKIYPDLTLRTPQSFSDDLYYQSISRSFDDLQRERPQLLLDIYSKTCAFVQLRMKPSLDEFNGLLAEKKNKKLAGKFKSDPVYFNNALLSISEDLDSVTLDIKNMTPNNREGEWDQVALRLGDTLKRIKNLEKELSEKANKLSEAIKQSKDRKSTTWATAAAIVAALAATAQFLHDQFDSHPKSTEHSAQAETQLPGIPDAAASPLTTTGTKKESSHHTP